ncbi:two-component system, cell cycle sensor histidine kinase PleC [Azospirillaceae bacterium]
MYRNKESVLIIDDNPLSVHDLSSVLADEYDILCATNGIKAIHLASNFIPDIILLDVVMPSMDGYEVCSRLKGMANTQNIPIIFVTARDDVEAETKGLGIGAVDFITKPVNPATVRARVRTHLTQRRIEEILRGTARRLSEAEELAHVGAWEWDVFTDTFHLSEEWLRIHGCDDPAMSFDDLTALVHPEDRARMSAALLGTAAGLQRFNLQYRIVRRNDRETRIVQVRGHIQRAADGSPLRMSGATQDITEQRLAELELERLKEAAEEANRAKSAFLATMSHELRTPLTSVIGFSEIIRDQCFGAVGNPVYAEYAGDINESGLHLLNLINDILDIAKIESGKMSIDPAPLETQNILSSVCRLIRQRAVANNLDISLSLPADIPELWADERAVKQIVYNLLSNAIKFTPAAGRIVLTADAGQNGGVEISVSDTGIGIPPNQLSRVLRPFEQIENVYSRAKGGTGLGLPLIKGLIELHGGTLTIESYPGVGTKVRVWFPAAPGRGSQGDRHHGLPA